MAMMADQMNYSSMYGNSAYPNNMPIGTMPQPQVQPGVAGAFTPQQQPGSTGYQTPQLTGWQKFGYVMDGIGAIGGLWGSIQQNKIAKQQLALSKEAYNTNMNNTIQSYNTTLSDRINARYAMEGKTSDAAKAYIDENKMKRS